MKHLLLLLLVFMAVEAKTQDEKAQDVDFYGNTVKKDICNSLGMADNVEAKNNMDKICDAADIPSGNFILQPCPNIGNCLATVIDGSTYILYDIQFFNKVSFGFIEKNLPKNQVDWTALTILAHELGHIECGHLGSRLVRQSKTRIKLELEADEYAGHIMYRLGATLEQAQEAMYSDAVSEEATLTHPARKDRLAAIKKGFNEERSKYVKLKKQAEKDDPVPATNQVIPPVVNNTPNQATVTNIPVNNPANNQVSAQTPVNPPATIPASSNPAIAPPVTTPVSNTTTNPVPNKPSSTSNKPDVKKIAPEPVVGPPGMVLVQGGTFKMGSNDGETDQKPAHQVTLGSFYISKYEVTQAEWQAVMGNNPSANKCDSCPVENISWDEARAFCAKQSNNTGKTYRLPTEAEWEYAARGGIKGKGEFYSGSIDIDEVGWYFDNSDGFTHPVGKKKPNELGVYDMTGNVWEWCSDLYGSYSSAAAQNPQGASSGTFHVFRGGSWNYHDEGCQVFSRGSTGHSDHLKSVGFRVVVSVQP